MPENNTQKYGFKKFLPAIAIQFCLAFSFIILQDLKTSTAMQTGGIALISSIQMWSSIPTSLILVLLYIKVANRFERQTHFSIFVLPAVLYFLIYGFYLYDHPDFFQITTSRMIDLQALYPGFDKLIFLYRHWPVTLLYFFSDIWSGFIVGVLFWQYLNDTTTVKQAKTFYPALGLFVSFGMVTAKAVTLLINPYAGHNIHLFTGVAAFSGVIAVIIHYLVCKNVISKDKTPVNVQSLKLNMTAFKTFGHVFTSKYLGLLALSVFAYGAILRLMTELHNAYTYKMVSVSKLTPKVYVDVMNKITIISTSFSFVFSVGAMALSIYLFKKHGWFKAAVMTPIVTIITALFLLYITYNKSLSQEFSPISFGIVFFLMMFIKQLKHFFFKPAKEMAYIPLKQEMKVKGKAFVDLFIERFAFSFGTIIYGITSSFHETADGIEFIVYKVSLLIIILSLVYLVAIWALAPKFKAAEVQNI